MKKTIAKICKKTYVAVLVVLLILLGSCGRGFSFAGALDKGASAASSEFGAIAMEIRQTVKELGYPDDVGQDLVKMISGWNCDIWKQKISQAKHEFQQKNYLQIK